MCKDKSLCSDFNTVFNVPIHEKVNEVVSK